MANAEGSDEMLNRVMTKDNIGLAALLETREGVFASSGGKTSFLWFSCRRLSNIGMFFAYHIYTNDLDILRLMSWNFKCFIPYFFCPYFVRFSSCIYVTKFLVEWQLVSILLVEQSDQDLLYLHMPFSHKDRLWHFRTVTIYPYHTCLKIWTCPIGLDKSWYQVNIFLISPRKHMLWVLIRSPSPRRF